MADITNGYATLAEFKDIVVPKSTSANVKDNEVIEDMIEAASRYIDTETSRTFYARTETRSFDTPRDRTLRLDDDLLSITTLTNGSSNVIASSDYILLPANETPNFAIKLKQSATISWELGSSGDSEQVISVLGSWGYMSTHTDEIKMACVEIANGYYRRRHGKSVESASRVTSAGVVIVPRDVSMFAQSVIRKYVRRI